MTIVTPRGAASYMSLKGGVKLTVGELEAPGIIGLFVKMGSTRGLKYAL